MNRAQRQQNKLRKQKEDESNGKTSLTIPLNFNDEKVSRKAAIVTALIETFDESKGFCTTAENTGISIAHLPKGLVTLMFETMLPHYIAAIENKEALEVWSELVATIKQSNTLIIQLYK